MISKLKNIRNQLLENNLLNEYKSIMSFFENPDENVVEEIINSFPTILKKDMEDVLVEIINIYETELSKYNAEILYGQRLIWSQVLVCFEALYKVRDRMQKYNLTIYDDDYLAANNEIKKIFACYAEAQMEMSKFEDTLGVDRYLDTLCDSDIKPLEKILSEIKAEFETKIQPYKQIFVKKWSTTNIATLIIHELVRYDGDNQVCTLFECNKKKTVLFVIDGFGYSQYQWHKSMNRGVVNYTYNENIFAWLDKIGCIKECVLGSAYITDTGAGLSQIFIGKSAIETGIISSKVGSKNSSSFIETKKIDVGEFKKIFHSNNSSITELVKIFNKKSKVLYGSHYGNNVSGFSDYIFKGAEVIEILPPERMFEILKDELEQEEEGLDVIYLTGIDNSGHTMGAYSKFEKFEHEKFNMLLRNFLIEMAMKNKEYFDGKTTFIITADHGMAESSKLMISRKILKDRLYYANIRGASFVENNRAMLIYSLSSSDYVKAKNSLIEYFNEIGVDVDILIKGTDEYAKWYCTDLNNSISNIAPDIVLRLISNGLFYSRETSQHLLHYGGHGGASAGELFVPLLQITLDDKLLKSIQNRFINIM